MIDTDGLLDGGTHTIATTYTKLDDSDQGFRVLTIRVEDNAVGNVAIGLLGKDGSKQTTVYLKTDESWTFGPNAGTIRPEDIYLKGTANDVVGWIGTKV